MDRNIVVDAVVIGSRRTGEANRELSLLSPELGVARVTIYGGQKSKKAQRPPLFSYGRFYLRRSGRGGLFSLDEVQLAPPCPFDYDLGQISIASFIAELAGVVGGPDPKETHALAVAAFKGLAGSSSGTRRNAVLVQFVWRLMRIAGLVADLDSCPLCDRAYSKEEFAFYNRTINFFTCRACSDDRTLFLGPGARRYLAISGALGFEEALDIPLNEETSLRIRKAMTAYAMNVCGFKLNSVRSGMV